LPARVPFAFELTQRISRLQGESARSPKRGPPAFAFSRFESRRAEGCQRPGFRIQIIFLHPDCGTTFWKTSTLNHIYEKICLIHNHRSNRRRVCGFLHATTGDNWNFDHGGDSRLAVAITGTKEEDHHQEEGQDRSVAFACGRIRIAFADTLKSVGARS